MPRRATGLVSSLILLLASGAAAEPLRIDRTAEKMRVDGALREWRGARFSELGSGDDASLRYALASVDEGLYLAAEVRDQELVTGRGGDALVLTLALPGDGGGWRARELWLLPGEAGKSASRAELREGKKSHADPRISVIEGPRETGPGYVLEAFVPWAALGVDGLWEQGRGSLRLRDVDGDRRGTTLATSNETQAGALPRLALGAGQRDLLGSFVAGKQLSGVEPRYDVRANVAGDAQPERVVVIDRYVVVYGPGYKGGEGSSYFELPYGLGGGLERAELRDLTGDGHAELLARVHQQNELGKRALLLVLSLGEAGIAPRFALELKKEVAGGFVENTYAIVSKGQRVPRLDVTPGTSAGLDASSYREAPARDAAPILLPWGVIASRSYAWDGTRFATVAEQARPASAAQAVSQPAPAQPSTATTPAPGDALAEFKRKAGLPASARPARSLRVDLLAGAGSEQVDVFGTQLVVTGAAVGGGRGYLSYGLPIAAPTDLVDLRSASLGTGAELLLARVRQPLSGAAGVERELLIVLRGDAQRLTRALVAEVARRQGTSMIENEVKLLHGQLVRDPGKARGWSARSYPFRDDAVGGAERLLLPWSDEALYYRDEGGALRAVATRAR